MQLPPHHSDQFGSDSPFRWAAFDDFLDQSRAMAAAEQFASVSGWHDHGGRKQSMSDLGRMAPSQRDICEHFRSPGFTHWLSDITGIQQLEVDNGLYGAGLHRTARDGRLPAHVDFNQIEVGGKTLYRRLNVFVYLTPDWRDDWGGHLVLCSEAAGKLKPEHRIAPKFNRFVMFETSENSWHGHPEPLACPADICRQSIACYYYTRERPAWAGTKHGTVYARKGQLEAKQ